MEKSAQPSGNGVGMRTTRAVKDGVGYGDSMLQTVREWVGMEQGYIVQMLDPIAARRAAMGSSICR